MPEVSLRATGAVAQRQRLSRLSRWMLLVATLVGVAALAVLLIDTFVQGVGRLLDPSFYTNYPSRLPERAGLRSSVLGSLWVLALMVLFAVPVAVGTALWVEEFAPRSRLLEVVKLNIANLAGVPSIIYGVLGLTVFVRFFGLGPSIVAGALTLFLMILPMTVIASQEALRQVPRTVREGSLALGATQWQTVWHHVLPTAAPGIITGVILALARAAGETAALIMIGGLTFIAFDNTSPLQDFTTLPIQIYNWTARPQPAFRENAAAAILVLMAGLALANVLAALLRERLRWERGR